MEKRRTNISMETDPKKIRKLSKEKEKENWEF
jgi:hypothetical protein